MSYSNLGSALEKNKNDLDIELKAKIVAHLQLLKQAFKRYFPDSATLDLPEWKLVRNPLFHFHCLLPHKIQEEFLKLKCTLMPKMTLNQSLSIISELKTCICVQEY